MSKITLKEKEWIESTKGEYGATLVHKELAKKLIAKGKAKKCQPPKTEK